jgi:hypothetical protein
MDVRGFGMSTSRTFLRTPHWNYFGGIFIVLMMALSWAIAVFA